SQRVSGHRFIGYLVGGIPYGTQHHFAALAFHNFYLVGKHRRVSTAVGCWKALREERRKEVAIIGQRCKVNYRALNTLDPHVGLSAEKCITDNQDDTVVLHNPIAINSIDRLSLWHQVPGSGRNAQYF